MVFNLLVSDFILQETYTDATLVCNGKFYSVHRFVLSTCSEYFVNIFEKTPCKNPFVILKDIECKDLEFLLDYMYLGEVNVKQTELASLIKAAECLRIKGLAVPDEDTSSNTKKESSSSNSKSKIDNQRESSPPVKRKRIQASTESPGRTSDQSSKSDDTRENKKGLPIPDSSPQQKLVLKSEPEDLDESNQDDFIQSINLTGSEDTVNDIENTSDAKDLNEFLQSTIEKEEPMHLSDYNTSDFPSTSELQDVRIIFAMNYLFKIS